jgi:hypothetical protein
MNNAHRTPEQTLTFYQSLLPESSNGKPGELRFVTFKTRNGWVIDVVVRADGKKKARLHAQQLVESGELCGKLKFVEVS